MAIMLSEEESKEDGREFLAQIDADERARKYWDDWRIVANNLYYGSGMRYDTHWQGASDIHLPVVTEKVDMVLPRIKMALGQDVQVQRVARDYDPEETRLQEHFINWAREHDIPDFELSLTHWYKNMLLYGCSFLKVYWKQKWRRTEQIHNLKAMAQAGETLNGYVLNAPQIKFVDNMLDELFGQGRWMYAAPPESGSAEFLVDIVEDRRRISNVRVKFEKSDLIDEVRIRVRRRILVQDSPCVDVIEPEHIIMPYRAKKVQTADYVAHRHYMTPDEIIRRADETDEELHWNLTEEDIKKLKDSKKAPTWQRESEPEQRVQEAKDFSAGVSRPDRANDDYNKLPVFEVYTCEDFDEDGDPEEVILQIVPALGKIVHCTYLETVFPHGMRPFCAIRYTQSSDRFYVPGLAVFLAAINIEVNTVINQVNDAQELINNPIFFFRPDGLTIDPKVLQNIPPGTGIPCSDPNSIVFPQWNKAPLANLQALDSMLMFADRMTVTPLTGGSTQMSNSPRMARGTIALLSESNVKLDMLVESIKDEGYKDLLRMLFGLYSSFGPDEKFFWVTGRDKKKRSETVYRQQFAGKYDFILTGTTVNSNPEIRRMVSQNRYAVGSTNPLYASDQMAFQNLLRDFYMHNDEGANIDLILPKLPGQSGQTHVPMTQEDEITAMRLGQPIDILPSDNDAEHLQVLQAFQKSPEFSTLEPHIAASLAHHGRAHAIALQQKMLQAQNQAQLAGGAPGGQANNVPTDLGNLEGGVQ